MVEGIMTNVRGSLVGSFPFSELLVQKVLDYKYGRSAVGPVQEQFNTELTDLITLQEESLFPVVTTGSFGVEDLLRPFTTTLETFTNSYQKIGDVPVTRWHNTNTFYRRPRLTQPLPEDPHVITQALHTLSGKSSYSHDAVEGKRKRLILPGPYTFASLVDLPLGRADSPYDSFESWLEQVGYYLGKELATAGGYEEVQLDEPALVWRRVPHDHRKSIVEAYKNIRGSVPDQKIIVHTYFGDANKVANLLLSLPVDGLGFDLRSTNLTHLAGLDLTGKVVQLGLVDSQNYIPNGDGQVIKENIPFLSSLVLSVQNLGASEVVVTPTTSLEYLPRPVAVEKVKTIAAIIQEVLK